MSLSPVAGGRDLAQSPFPLEPEFGQPWRPWYQDYPKGVPRGLRYPPLRAEQLLLLAAAKYPDRQAIWYFGTRWTYSELCDRVRQVAANFARLGVRTGD